MERVTVSNGHCGNKQTKSTLPTILLFSPLPNNRCETRRLFKKKCQQARTTTKRNENPDNEEQLQQQDIYHYQGQHLRGFFISCLNWDYCEQIWWDRHDNKCWVNKARIVFNILRKVCSAHTMRRKPKLRIFNSNLESVLPHGFETWRAAKKATKNDRNSSIIVSDAS